MLNYIFQSTPLRFLVQSIWRDEAFSYLLAKEPLFRLLTLTAHDSNPPLYYILLKVWMTPFGHSELSMRILSVLFFWATIYIVFLILTSLLRLSVRKSLVYLLLFIINPLLHYYAFEARMYSMLTFFATLSFYLLMKKRYRAYSLTVLLGLYVHYFMILALVCQVIYVIISRSKEQPAILKQLAKTLVWFVPWIGFVIISKPPLSNEFWILKPTLLTLRDLPAIIITGFEPDLWFTYNNLALFSFFLMFFIIIGIIQIWVYNKGHHSRKEEGKLGLLFSLWGLAAPLCVFIVSIYKPILLPRYIIFATVGFLLFLIHAMEHMHPKLRALLFIILASFSLQYASLQVVKRNKANVRKPLMEIKRSIAKGDVLLVTHEFNFHPAEYYLNDSQVYLFGKTYPEIPWFVGKVLIPEEKITTSIPSYPNKAFILKEDLTYEVQSRL